MNFEDFYVALYPAPKGEEPREPFPWQSELAKRIVAHGWPSVPILDLPTAAGKTTVLDIAVFHLVHQLKTGEPRTAPLRLFFIVDRRIVVDGTFRHARRLADRLAEAKEGLLKDAADLLKHYFEVERPLHVSVMRGGMYRDDGWTSSPVQPTICVSTVDQLGSRLLFRGYGVSPSMRPVHAALVANDSLLFIDEAHLSEPFLQTLAAVRDLTQLTAETDTMGRPLRFVQMSATTGESDTRTFGLDENLEKLDTVHPVLKKRLEAKKVATLQKVPVDKDDSLKADQEFAKTASGQALALAGLSKPEKKTRHKSVDGENEQSSKPVRVIGVIVNRVRAARLIWQELEKGLSSLNGDDRRADVLLLTARIRPFDRDNLLFRDDAQGEEGWMHWIAADRKHDPERQIFVVATQTVEVGADISFDALVTEGAPLDCLRQRFGRLDRLGERGTSQAVIIGRSISVAKTADDPIYGMAIGATWTWLTEIAMSKQVDFGLSAMKEKLDSLSTDDLMTMCAPRKDAPFLQPPYAELWSQTNPAPAADPDISRFLHGEDSRPPDVQVVWRADLLNHGEDELLGKHKTDYINTVALVPPTQMEACSVPLRDVQQWLCGRPGETPDAGTISDELADVEGGRAPDEERWRSALRPRWVLRWQGPEKSRLVPPQMIRPGDTIVVPSIYGGTDKYGWNPGSTKPVADVAESCVRWSRGRALLRYHPAVAKQLRDDEMPSVNDTTSPSDTEVDVYLDWLSGAEELPSAVRHSIASLHTNKHRREFAYELADSESSPGFVLIGRNRLPITMILDESQRLVDDLGGLEEVPEEDDASSFIGEGRQITLEEHSDGVLRHVEEFARRAELPPRLQDDLTLAAKWHDVGKIDLRFQAMLHNGSEIDAIVAMSEGRLLGKSNIPPNDRAARRRARRLAGVPEGFRHEELSVVLLQQPQQASLLTLAQDRDLVLFLIGAHHGVGRPMHLVDFDNDPPDIDVVWQEHRWQIDAASRTRHALFRLENDWPGLFARLNRRYGLWGLAWLEALFRLADHRQSALDAEPVDLQLEEEAPVHA